MRIVSGITTKSVLGLGLAVFGTGLTGCPTTPATDAGADVVVTDSGTPVDMGVTTDVPTTLDVVTTDVVTADVVVPADVVTADARGDVATTCSSTLPTIDQLSNFTHTKDEVDLWLLDASDIMFGNPGIFPFTSLHAMASSPPAAVSGNCIYLDTWDGTAARQSSAVPDRGRITATQGSMPIVWTYDSVMHLYPDADSSMATDAMGLSTWTAGLPVTLTLAGGAGGPGGMATLNLPALVTPGSRLVGPRVISRTAPSTYTWTPPAGLPANAVAQIMAIDNQNFSTGVYCWAPACAGTVTIPAAIAAHMPASAARFLALTFPVTTTIGTTNPVNFTLHGGVMVAASTGP